MKIKKDKYGNGWTDEYVFFFKQRSPFSQWYFADFTDEKGITFNCCEQYMMYKKAMVFDDPKIGRTILNANHPSRQKKLGRQVRRFSQEVWEYLREDIVYEGNLLKFSQNQELKKLLLKTGDRKLVEASPYDKIWGVKMSMDDPNILNKDKWRGLNLLGKALMEVREELLKGENFHD
ncbi:MAG: NADAR family protein [bacterium]